MIELSVPLLVSLCGLIMTIINVVNRLYRNEELEAKNLIGLIEAAEECVGNDFSRDIEVHIIVNNNASVRYISAVDFDPDRFIEWADLHEHGLFIYDLIKSYTMRSDMKTVECWKLYMWFKVESDLCRQEIQGLPPI